MIPAKEFVIRHVIEDVLDMEEGKEYNVTEKHFGLLWNLDYSRKNGFFRLHVVPQAKRAGLWSIMTETTLKLISPIGTTLSVKEEMLYCLVYPDGVKWGWENLVSWDRLEYEYEDDGKVTIEAHVDIQIMYGFGKENLRSFNESVKECSDVVLVINDREFYLSKYFLALQSSYFKKLLFGNFEESQNDKIELKDINPDDFQNFLELIHGESSVDDDTVTGILHLAEMYDAPTAIRRCEEFLLEKSKKKSEQKLQLSLRYGLENLKTKCLSEITTISDIQSIVSSDPKEMDVQTAMILLQKCLSFSNK
ncbi:hypothetical protein B9Z55_007763 [Caenorhabditis nigoni]|uniref:BTB domain-containing protein n=1 Tax=Caenorhabditis nigoni TaxID=1611254 RepID=A0A2G5VB47_9PELO|nr:hypothetical protein B9Z55_007763 [Caenorhabditis nigoni]